MKSAETFCRTMGVHKPPRNTMIRRLARSLSATYNVPPGDELVLIVGEGNETNNLAAIESWVYRSLLDLDEPTARDVLTHLVFRFGETLEQWEVSRW